MDNTSLTHLTENNLVLAALGEALAQLDAGDLEAVKTLLVECRLYLAEAIAVDATKH